LIQSLDLTCAGITDEDLTAIANAICNNCKNNAMTSRNNNGNDHHHCLESIKLDMNPLIGVNRLHALCVSFAKRHAIKLIRIVKCNLNIQPATVVAEMIKNNATMTVIVYVR
jgi:hypothetical protein